MYSDPADCAAMFWCVGGERLSLRCPIPGQNFDPTVGACSFYARSNCRRGRSRRQLASRPVHILHPDIHPGSAGALYAMPLGPYQQRVVYGGGPHVAAKQPGYPLSLGTQRYQALTLPESAEAKSDQKNVVCYFSNWAGLRDGDGTFAPENLDAALCSHVVYAFAALDTESLEMVPSAPRTDIESGERKEKKRNLCCVHVLCTVHTIC